MPSRRLFLPLLPAAFAAVARAAAPPLWVSGEVPPYLWRDTAGPRGYAFELFRRVTAQAGVHAELRFYPWARALHMLQAGQAQVALVITRTPERESQYRWLFPVGHFRFAVVTRAADGPVFGTIAALKDRRVGSMRASASQGMLAEAGAGHVVEGKDYAELLVLLRRGIVDAVIGPDAAMRSVDTAGPSTDLRLTLLDEGRDLYAAAGAAMPERHVEGLRAAYRHLVDTGFIARLRKRHPDAFPAD